jgi:fibronectin-binding autotransporter adhesin
MRHPKRLSRKRASAVGLAVFAFLGGRSVLAQTQNSTWNGSSSNAWNNAANWSPGGVPNNNTNGFTDYNVTIGAPSPTDVTASFTIDSMTVGTAGLVNIIGGNSLTLNGPTLDDESEIVVNSNGAVAGTGLSLNTVTVSGGGTIDLDSDATTTTAAINGTLTLMSANSIVGEGAVNAFLTNYGTLQATQSGHLITLQTDNETNNNLYEATNGGTLSVISITISQGTSGQITAATGSAVNITGATISGGTLNGSGLFQVLSGNSAFANLTINAAVNEVGNQSLTVNGNLTDTGILTVNSNAAFAGTGISFTNGTFSGGGAIFLNDDATTTTATVNGTLILAAGSTIDGEGAINATLTNNGTVNANQSGHEITLQSNSEINNNLYEATNGGTLAVSNITISQGTSGQINSNTGSLLSLSSATITGGAVNISSGGGLQMASSTIAGGTFTVSTAATVNVTSGTNTVGGLTNNGSMNLLGSSTVDVLGNLFNSGTIKVNSNQAFIPTGLSFNGGTISGAGTIILDDDGTTTTATINGTVTQAAGDTISGEGAINAALTNFGILNANQTAHLITLQTSSEINNNLYEASSGGTLAVTNITISQGTSGQINSNTASLVSLSSTTVTGGAVNVFSGGIMQLSGSAISGGTVTVGTAGTVNVTAGTTTLGGFTNNGNVNILGNGVVDILGNLTNSGTITVNSNQAFAPTTISFNGGTVSGGGTIVLDDDGTTTTATINGTVTQAAGDTISGEGTINAALTNFGILNANQTAHLITLQTSSEINNNLYEASNGGTLTSFNITITQGTSGNIMSNASSLVSLTATTVTGGAVNVASGGNVQIVNSSLTGGTVGVSSGGTLTFTGGTDTVSGFSNSGTVNVAGASVAVNVQGNLVNSGIITVNNNAAFAPSGMMFNGGTVSGGGTIVLNDDAAASTATISGTVIQSAGDTISGEGYITANLTNNGVVNANVSGHAINLQNFNETNNNVYEASNGGTLAAVSISISQGTSGQITANTGSLVNLNGVTVIGGSLNGTGLIQLMGNTANFGNVTNNGTINETGGVALTVNGNLSNTGTITVNSNAAFAPTSISFNSGTLSGGGTIVLNSDAVSSTAAINGTLMQAAGNTISGDGYIHAAFTNNGTVNANQPGHAITLDDSNQVNNNLLEATNGGTLAIGHINLSQGTAGQINATGTGSLLSMSGANISAGLVTIGSGSALQFTANASTVTGPIGSNGTISVQVGNSSTPVIVGGITGSGALNFSSSSYLRLGANAAQNTISAIAFNGGGGLDITNNTLAINFGAGNDPGAAVLAALSAGYNSGAWTGTAGTAGAIVSSTAANAVALNSVPLLSVGYGDGNVDTGLGNTTQTAATAGQVLVKLTLAGDAFLDGIVNFNDLDVIGRHLNTSGNDWAEGNFNYDPNGAVNFNDLDIVGQNLNKTLNGSAVELGGTTISLGQVAQTQNSSVVPEPSAILLSVGAAAGLLARRRRRAIGEPRR